MIGADVPPATSPDGSASGRDRQLSSRVRLVISAGGGLVVGVAVWLLVGWTYGLLAGWMAAAVLFSIRLLTIMLPMDAEQTKVHAVREDPGRAAADLFMVVAALASLVAVAILLLAGDSGERVGNGVLSLASIALGWITVQTIYVARYARIYYSDQPGGVEFNQHESPQYSDFAYLAFTVGMTYQVSDTDLTTKDFRATVLNHALLSFVFGAVIIASTINLIAGLAD